MTTAWIGWALLNVAFAAFGMLIGYLWGWHTRNAEVLRRWDEVNAWTNEADGLNQKLDAERAAHEATTLRCSEAEARLAAVRKALVAP